ncbi:hypothetical protein I4S89_001662 [Vibrio cholerae]|nr:hypothetical protein [Vibrio cholerae]
MAAFGGYPQNVTFSTVNVAKGGGSENLLINPRGKINQLNEPDGVLSAGVYFCDGWKAGASGAEVYRDADGFRLISGSIVQLVPNNLGAGRNLRANMDIISGTPVMSINGGSDNAVSSDGEYISLEISGNNSKFNRIILAESLEIPIYQQSSDELTPCLAFCEISHPVMDTRNTVDTANWYPFSLFFTFKSNKKRPYAVRVEGFQTSFSSVTTEAYEQGVILRVETNAAGAGNNSYVYAQKIIADARP